MANQTIKDVLSYQFPPEVITKLQGDVNVPLTTYADISGTPGSGTANTYSGRFAIASGASTATVTNSLVTATSVVLVQMEAADSAAIRAKVVPGAGSFAVTVYNAAGAATPAAANLAFSFVVVK